MSLQNIEERTRGLVNLANSRLGSHIVSVTDDFFAPAQRMLAPSDPMFIPGKFDDHGKWMDGWESRRRRGAGYDSCVTALACNTEIHAIEIDTRHFTGNFPPMVSIDGDQDDDAWTELVPISPISGDGRALFELNPVRNCRRVRVNIFPDGGIARLRVYGRAVPDWAAIGVELIDFASVLKGARVVACNDQHFGSPWNLLLPEPGINMGDGWETRRRREPGNDWVILALGRPARMERVVVDTAFFKGNYPESFSIQGALLAEHSDALAVSASQFWPTLLGRQELQMDCALEFHIEPEPSSPINYVRFNIYPDGGVSRLRLLGRPAEQRGERTVPGHL